MSTIKDWLDKPHSPSVYLKSILHHQFKEMIKNLPFDQHVADYEAWFKHYPYVYQSELKRFLNTDFIHPCQ